VADKPKHFWWLNNVFVDDRGFPDKYKDYQILLHNIDDGPILHKLKHPPPPFDEVDPKFFYPYNESKHGERLMKDLDLPHLEPAVRNRIHALIERYWYVFDIEGIFVPVKNDECVINTGDSKPITVKRTLYGPIEIPIMRNAIAALKRVIHLQQIHDGRWLFKALLASKPYQEHVRDIGKFVWCFYVYHTPLNSVTRIIAYPFPCCDLEINEEFGRPGYVLLVFDVPMRYHQLAVPLASQEKLAF
jgi:hypothetical protein